MENKKKKERKKKSPKTLQHLKSYTKEELENIQVPKLEQSVSSVSNSYKVLVRDEVCSLRCSVIQLHGSVKCLNQRWGNKANQ